MNNQFRRARLLVFVVVVSGAAAGCASSAQPVAALPASETATPIAAPPPQRSPEDQAKADLEELVRGYEAAENEVFLQPESDPGTVLDPYLRGSAYEARVADILAFRREGNEFDTRTAVIHSLSVTELEMSLDTPRATISECATLSGSGTDGANGQRASFSNRRLTTWSAESLASGSWRLTQYSTGDSGSC